MRRRSFALAAGATLVSGWSRSFAATEEFPSKPINVIVPYAAGGADTFIRPLGPALEKRHGIRMVVESVVGAGGTLGTARVKRSPADGYTVLFCGSGAFTIAPKLQATQAPVADDFLPVMNLIAIPYFIATKKGSPIQDMRQLIDHIKSKPGALTYGSPGNGSAPHLGMEALARRLQSSVTHIPYTGVSTALQALMGGHVDAVIGAPGNILPQAEAGNVSVLAVAAKERFALAPNVPALGEAGIDIDVATHFELPAVFRLPRVDG